MIHSAVVDPTCVGQVNCGGTVTVNDFTIIIPKNLVFQFPAAWVPFAEVAAGNFLGLEVVVSTHLSHCRFTMLILKQIDGDRVPSAGGAPPRHIAGMVSISEFMLEQGQGHIATVNADNSITVYFIPDILYV
jgi:hypothetical protein